jgi:hypothetical protein
MVILLILFIFSICFRGRAFVPAAVAAHFWFVHSNSLHPFDRKRREASYKFFASF